MVNNTSLQFMRATQLLDPDHSPRGRRKHDLGLPDGGALQTVYLLIELSNDAVEFRDALLVSKRRSLLDVLMLSHEVGLLTLESRDKKETAVS